MNINDALLKDARTAANAARFITMPGKAAVMRAQAVRAYRHIIDRARMACAECPYEGEQAEAGNDTAKAEIEAVDPAALDYAAVAEKELATVQAVRCVDDSPCAPEIVARAKDADGACFPMLAHVARVGWAPATDDPDLDPLEIAEIEAEATRPAQIVGVATEGKFKLNTGE